jgi:hypothetical protein
VERRRTAVPASACRFDHDHAVMQRALLLLCEGYHVKAQVEGWFETPDVIYGYRPDIVAQRGDQILIVEVKAGKWDWPKISALMRFEKTGSNCKLLVVDPEPPSSQAAS